MFGKNPISKPRLPDDGFQVHSMFYTIQGEGPWVGRPTIFIRFSGCNLRCFWCDTDFTGGEVMTADALIERMAIMSRAHACTDFVLTGGEPMLQPLPVLLERAPGDWLFQVETAGTVWPAGLEFCMQDERVLLVCSPKTGSVHGMIKSNCHHWKYVVGVDELLSPDGLPNLSTQLPGTPQRIYRPDPDYEIVEQHVIYVQGRDDQAEDRTRANIKAAADIAMRHGYMLSVQIHKIAELP